LSGFDIAQRRRQRMILGEGAMGIVRTGRRPRQLFVPPREELHFQIRIGLFQRLDSGQPQTFHQPILRRLETALDAALGQVRQLQRIATVRMLLLRSSIHIIR